MEKRDYILSEELGDSPLACPIYSCDRCGERDITPHSVYPRVGTDHLTGVMETTRVDLCIGCCRAELERFVDLLGPTIGVQWINRVHANEPRESIAADQL
jgi:hypothetical protein